MSKIEEEILHPDQLFAVIGLEIKPAELLLTFAQWENLSAGREIRFRNARLVSLETTYSNDDLLDEPDMLQMPWDWIGVESEPISNGRWQFILVSHVVELAFTAEWPEYNG